MILILDDAGVCVRLENKNLTGILIGRNCFFLSLFHYNDFPFVGGFGSDGGSCLKYT